MSNATIRRRQKRIRSLGLLVFILGLFLIGSIGIFYLSEAQNKALESAAVEREPSIVDYLAPNLELSDLQGNPVSLADYGGQVILVNNWATWCPPCKAEMPELQDYFSAHSENGFNLIAINSGESTAAVEKFVSQNGITFPVWLDPNSKALDAFQNWGLPSSFVIDRDGIVRMTWTGEINRATLEKYLTPLLEE